MWASRGTNTSGPIAPHGTTGQLRSLRGTGEWFEKRPFTRPRCEVCYSVSAKKANKLPARSCPCGENPTTTGGGRYERGHEARPLEGTSIFFEKEKGIAQFQDLPV